MTSILSWAKLQAVSWFASGFSDDRALAQHIIEFLSPYVKRGEVDSFELIRVATHTDHVFKKLKCTLLHLAASKGNPLLTEDLLSHGAIATLSDIDCAISAQNVSYSNRYNTVKLLLRKIKPSPKEKSDLLPFLFEQTFQLSERDKVDLANLLIPRSNKELEKLLAKSETPLSPNELHLLALFLDAGQGDFRKTQIIRHRALAIALENQRFEAIPLFLKRNIQGEQQRKTILAHLPEILEEFFRSTYDYEIDETGFFISLKMLIGSDSLEIDAEGKYCEKTQSMLRELQRQQEDLSDEWELVGEE